MEQFPALISCWLTIKRLLVESEKEKGNCDVAILLDKTGTMVETYRCGQRLNCELGNKNRSWSPTKLIKKIRFCLKVSPSSRKEIIK